LAHIASFAGFAPVNKPAVAIAVMLDSPRGAHHGGDVAAPLFGRVTQQVLAYMNIPHDADFRNSQRLMIRAAAKPSELSEGSPDHLSETVEWAGAELNSLETVELEKPKPASATSASMPTPKETARAKVIAASFTPPSVTRKSMQEPRWDPKPVEQARADQGTVILDSEGARTAPSLLGMSVRAAIIAAQEAGIELDVIGSGVAREQSPAPGALLPAGGKVAVRFSR
jgi:cell division protein FtsI (penicillin-binding protein 3)